MAKKRKNFIREKRIYCGEEYLEVDIVAVTNMPEAGKVKKNDHKWSFRKLREYAKTPEDKEVWRKLYKGYEPTKIDFEYNDYTGWNCYLRLRKVRD